MTSVRMYTFVMEIDGLMYGGTLPARSFDEAQELVPFAEVDGELIAEIYLPDHEPIFLPKYGGIIH
jgi:hypothetical protein